MPKYKRSFSVLKIFLPELSKLNKNIPDYSEQRLHQLSLKLVMTEIPFTKSIKPTIRMAILKIRPCFTKICIHIKIRKYFLSSLFYLNIYI